MRGGVALCVLSLLGLLLLSNSLARGALKF